MSIKFLVGDKIELNISKRIFQTFILVAIAISGLDFIFLLIGELTDLSDSYTFGKALKYSVLIMPYRIYDMFGYFCLLSALIGLGSLTDQGEIIASRILGKSFFRIILASFRPILVLVLLGLLASDIWIPNLSQKAEEDRSLARDLVAYDSGYWIKKDLSFIHIDSIPDDELLDGIVIYELDANHRLNGIIEADSASLINGVWYLEGFHERLNVKGNISSVDGMGLWKKGPKEFDLQPILSHRYLSMSELIQRINSESEISKKSEASLEFWKKVLQPLTTLGLLFLAASLLFGPMRDNKGGLRLLVGILIAFVLDLFQKLFGSISLVTSLSAFWAVMIPIIFMFLIASLSFRRL